MLTRRLHNFPTCCHVQWMTVVHWAVNLSTTEYSETTAYQTTSNCGGPFFCPRDLCPKQDPIMGPRACSILRMEGRRFAYGILRENTDRCGLWIFCFCSGEYCCECPGQFAHPSRAGSSPKQLLLPAPPPKILEAMQGGSVSLATQRHKEQLVPVPCL